MENANSAYLQETLDIQNNLSEVKNKIAVISGKGGVGKSTIASNLAAYFSNNNFKTGLLDVDIHGPSVPKMLGLENSRPVSFDDKIIPVDYSVNLKAISIGFLLNDKDDAIIWRGPKKAGIIRSLLKDVIWESLDYMIIDCPPGTGDEPLSILQSIENITGVVIVTTPQDVALIDVKKSVKFCNTLNVPILGVIENMSGFTCPNCNHKVDIFKSGGGDRLSKEFNIPFLGSISIDSSVVEKADKGILTVLSAEETVNKKEMISAFVNLENRLHHIH